MTCFQEISRHKSTARAYARRIAATLPPEDGSTALTLCATKQYSEARVIFTYVGVGAECATLPLISHALAHGKAVCVPYCEEASGIMSARYISSVHELKGAAMGLLQPASDSRIAQPGEIDIAVVPCVAADINNNRLGHGHGYYDRYLSMCNAYKVLLCRRELLLAKVPCDANDIRCDITLYPSASKALAEI